MDCSCAPAQAPVSEPDTEGFIDMVLMYSYTCVSALMVIVTFSIVVTRFRLWHASKFLKKIPQLASSPVNTLITQALGFATAYQYQRDVPYFIWVVILLVAFDNVSTLSSYSLLESAADRRSREYNSLFNYICTGVIIIIYLADSEFHTHFWS